MASVRGLRSEAERKNSWQVAEACGDPTPYGCPSWLARADWDAAMVRDELCTDLIQHLGAPTGVLVRDETGVVNQGRHAAGVARQSTGTVGTVEHGPSGVWLG
jgi:SRSO17 transposase